MVSIGGMYRCQNVEFNLMFFELVQTGDHRIEGGPAAFVYPVGVVQRTGTIEAQANQELMLMKKATPLVI